MARTKKNTSDVGTSSEAREVSPPKTKHAFDVTMMTNAELATAIRDSHAELVCRGGKKDPFVAKSAALAWIAVVLHECGRGDNPSYWLASRPKTMAATMRNACIIADDFVRSTGSWSADQFKALQKWTVHAVRARLLATGYESADAEMIVLGLRNAAEAFEMQYPGYVGAGALTFLIQAGV